MYCNLLLSCSHFLWLLKLHKLSEHFLVFKGPCLEDCTALTEVWFSFIGVFWFLVELIDCCLAWFG